MGSSTAGMTATWDGEVIVGLFERPERGHGLVVPQFQLSTKCEGARRCGAKRRLELNILLSRMPRPNVRPEQQATFIQS